MANASPTLSVEQNSAVQGIITKEIKILVGKAGSGKSSVIKVVYDKLGDSLCVVAPTHNAACLLEKSGIPSVRQAVAFTHNTKNSLPNQLVRRGVTHVIVDESSMINRHLKLIIDDVCAHAGIHVTYVGDPRQLPPVDMLKANYRQNWFAAAKPDFILTENFRQEAGVEPILVQDTYIDPKATHICMTNAMRNRLNIACHEDLYGEKAYSDKNKTILNPQDGQYLIANFTTNGYKDKDGNNKVTYRNNALYQIESVKRTRFHFKIKFKDIVKSVIFDKKDFAIDNQDRKFDFSYAITCHSAQGMGFDDVYVHLECAMIDKGEVRQWDYALPDIAIENWLYTAMTRGKKSITVVDPTGAVKREGLSLSIDSKDYGKTEAIDVAEPAKTLPVFATVKFDEVIRPIIEELIQEVVPAPKPVNVKPVEQDDETFMEWFMTSGTATDNDSKADKIKAKQEQHDAEYDQLFKVDYLAQRRARLAEMALAA